MHLIYNKLLINLLACGLVFTSALDAQALVRSPCTLSATKPIADTALKNGSSTQTLNWTTFTSEESGFSVSLPKNPEHVHQKIAVPKTDLSIEYDTFVSEPSESVVYVVSVWHYPTEVDMSKPEVNLQDGFNGMLSALPGSQVLTMQTSDMDGFKTLEFLVKNDDIYFQGKLILVYNTLYQVFTVYKGKEDMKQNYEKFINSFKLINPEHNKVAPKAGSGAPAKKMNV